MTKSLPTVTPSEHHHSIYQQALRDALTPVVFGDAAFADVAEQLGITERAVEGRLYRYRAERARRRSQRGIR